MNPTNYNEFSRRIGILTELLGSSGTVLDNLLGINDRNLTKEEVKSASEVLSEGNQAQTIVQGMSLLLVNRDKDQNEADVFNTLSAVSREILTFTQGNSDLWDKNFQPDRERLQKARQNLVRVLGEVRQLGEASLKLKTPERVAAKG